MPQKIFISYRREDSAANALGIGQYLENEFGRKNVFIDIDMRAGTKFPAVLEQRLAECKVMLVLIGPDWLNSRDGQGQRRLDNPDDWVRLEIGHALKRNITVIPVRVNGVDLPPKTMLPEEIRGLLDHQAISVSTPSFRSDMAGLAKDIRSIPTPWPWRRFGAIAAVAAPLLLVAGLVVGQVLGFIDVVGRIRPILSQVSGSANQNGIWSSRPGEWVMWAVDKTPVAYYFNPVSVKAFGDKVVYTARYPSKPSNTTVQSDKSSAYEDDITVLDCKKSLWAMAERTNYNKSGEVVSHYKWGDPATLDLSIGGSINAGTLYSLAAHIMCDEQLRMPLFSSQQLADNFKLSHLFSTPSGDGEMFHGQVKDISKPPYEKELLLVIKLNEDHMFSELLSGQTVRGIPVSYRAVADLIQVNCTDRKILGPKVEYFDAQSNLVYVTAPLDLSVLSPAPSSPFDKVVNIACGATIGGTYEGMNTATYKKGGQGDHKISITIEQVSGDLNVVFQTADGAQGKGSGKLTGNRVETISLESTTPGCPGSYKGSMEFPGDTVTWSYKGEDCGGAMEGHGTAKKVKS